MGIYDDDFVENNKISFDNNQKNKKKSIPKQKKKIIKKDIDKKKITKKNHTDTVVVPKEITAKSITPNDFFSSIKPTPEYIKHLIECRCFLPQFLNLPNPIQHKFIVFSELDDYGNVKTSYAACNNCGLIHRIVEVETSIIIGKETMLSLQTIDDIKPSLPDWLIGILDKHQCSDLHTWQEAKFILENELWGRFVVLIKEKDKEMTTGKLIQILGKELYKVEIFERDDGDARRE
jgi:hypothetical protein